MKQPIASFREHMQVILRKMCADVNADPDKIDFGADNWYWEHQWTESEEAEFKEWMANYLYSNTAARREIMSISHKNKKNCKEMARWFIWNHGWKIKEDG